MTTDALLSGYVTLSLVVIGGLAMYSAHREKRFGPTATDDRIFRCDKCGFVYTDDPDVDRSRCSQCGRLNDAIRF